MIGRFLRSILILSCLSFPVFATQVTMTATTLSNFHPPSAGSAVTGTLTATSGLTTVTGNFRTQWINLSGFRINIAGTDYTVANVVSATSLTLTTGYVGATGTKSFTVYPFVLLRFYALQRFTESSTQEVIQPGTPGSSAWYKQLGCSIIGTTLYIPQTTLPSTTNAVNPGERGAKWYAAFYYLSGGFISTWSGLESFALDFTPNPKTWAQAVAYANTGIAPPPNTDTYSKSQIDALFHGGGGGTGTVTSITAGSGLSGGTITSAGTISITDVIAANTCTNCNLTFNSRGQITLAGNGSSGGGSGTVTSVTAGSGLSGGTFTVSGTISLPDLISPHSCTSCDLTVDAKGRVTLASDGSGGSGGSSPGQLVISFPDTTASDVNAGFYWPANIALPAFTYEVWIKQLHSTFGCGCYFIADGGGGAHSILWGFAGEDGIITGNITTHGLGTDVSFGSIDPIDLGEWHHQALVWSGQYMLTFVNGVPSGAQYFTGPRVIGGPTEGNSQFYVGGSDHNNFVGYMSSLRGMEGDTLYGGGFRPERNFTSNIETGSHHTTSLLYDFTQGEHIVHDLSDGFLGVLHHGLLDNQVQLNGSIAGLPHYVTDTTAPMYNPNATWPVPVGSTPTPPSTPGSALIFDSFSRPRQTRMLTNPVIGKPYTATVSATNGSATIVGTFPAAWVGTSGFIATIGNGNYTVTAVTDTSHLTITPVYGDTTSASAAFSLPYGTTESGSFGPMPWIYAAYDGYGATNQWGIMSGQAVVIGTLFFGSIPGAALVDTGVSDVDLYVDRVIGSYASKETSLAFRYQDKDNFWYITVLDRGDSPTGIPNTGYNLCKASGGGEFCQAPITGDTANWATLRVVAKGDHIQVYAGAVLKFDIHDAAFQTATKHGLLAFPRNPPDGGPWVPQTFMRWDNFTVKAAP